MIETVLQMFRVRVYSDYPRRITHSFRVAAGNRFEAREKVRLWLIERGDVAHDMSPEIIARFAGKQVFYQ